MGSDAKCLDNDGYDSKARVVQETASCMVQGDLKAVQLCLSSVFRLVFSSVTSKTNTQCHTLYFFHTITVHRCIFSRMPWRNQKQFGHLCEQPPESLYAFLAKPDQKKRGGTIQMGIVRWFGHLYRWSFYSLQRKKIEHYSDRYEGQAPVKIGTGHMPDTKTMYLSIGLWCPSKKSSATQKLLGHRRKVAGTQTDTEGSTTNTEHWCKPIKKGNELVQATRQKPILRVRASYFRVRAKRECYVLFR